MSRLRFSIQNLLPIIVFFGVVVLHYFWVGFFPEVDPDQIDWVSVPMNTSWWSRYFESQEYWLGYSYGSSLAFAVVALQRYRKHKSCYTRNFAIGGITVSSFLAVAGCYLIGCCGSPMLIVYLNIFGIAFLPLIKPLIAGITTLMISLAWLWILHAEQKKNYSKDSESSPKRGCGCE